MGAQRGEIVGAVTDPQPGMGSPRSQFRHATFTVLWTAAVVANIGTWMYNAAAGWLMTSLSADPLIVSLVQVATSLPMFLFALPAGALADIVDRRRFLIAIEGATTVISAIIAALVWLNLVTPGTLLLFTFLLGAGAALTAPAWQSIVPRNPGSTSFPSSSARSSRTITSPARYPTTTIPSLSLQDKWSIPCACQPSSQSTTFPRAATGQGGWSASSNTISNDSISSYNLRFILSGETSTWRQKCPAGTATG